MRTWSRRSARPPAVDINDFDDVNYDVLVHVPFGAPQPSAESIRVAVYEALDLPSERVETRMFFPFMGG
jgi:hypothetical protein